MVVKKKLVRFLSDLPLSADRQQDMRFGHSSIVNNLKNIVTTCPRPFTLGLFAKWGTGKTSILDALKYELYGTSTAVVKIDAWKHEGDALRRTFLSDALTQLKEIQNGKEYLSKDEKLSENWKEPIIRTFQSGFKYDKSILLSLIGFFLAFIVIGGLIFQFWRSYFGMFVSFFFGGGLFTGLFLFLLHKAITTETITKTIDRFKDPREFEEEWTRIVGLIQCERLLIILDNLDRVSCDKAIELLATIKTFMENNKCVFLIACDDEAIKRHLERTFANETPQSESNIRFDGDEFLRKFFNGYLIIPDFIDTELQDYTEHLLAETNLQLPDFSDVAFVIAVAFRDNPRQIKQFINTFTSHYLLAEAREAKRELPPGSISKHTAYLAKHLIIMQNFPVYYKKYLDAGTLINEFGNDTKLRSFITATQPIKVVDIRPFRYLKLSQDELAMTDIQEIQLALQDNDTETIQKIINQYQKDTTTLRRFNRFIIDYIERNKERILVLYNAINSTLLALRQLGLKLDRHFYQKVAEGLSDEEKLGSTLSQFDPELIINQVLAYCSDEIKAKLLEKYIGLYNNPEQINNQQMDRDTFSSIILRQLIEHFDWLNSDQRLMIQKSFEEKHFTYPMLSMIVNYEVARRELISDVVISNYIKAIQLSDIDSIGEFNSKIELLYELEDIITESNLQDMTSKFSELLEQDVANPYREEKLNLVHRINDFLSHFSDRLTSIPQDIRNDLATRVINSTNALENWEQRAELIPTCILLMKIVDESMGSQIESLISTILSNANINSLKSVLLKIQTKSDREELVSKYEPVLRARAMSDDAFFTEFYPLVSKEMKTQWMETLIQSDHNRAFNKLREFNYKTDDRKRIVSALLNKADGLPLDQREELYSACNLMNCANDVTLREKLASNIKAYLCNHDHNLQVKGLNLFRGASHLPATQRRDIVTDTIEWLSSLPPDTAYHPSSIQSVLEQIEILPWVPRQKFLDFIFIKLIQQGISVDSINLGFSVLKRYLPPITYESYQTYFDDIFNRIETESEISIKTALINGLRSLMPNRPNQKNKEYWEKIRQLPDNNTETEQK